MYRNAHFSEKYFLLGMNDTFYDANFFVRSPYTVKYPVDS